MPACRLRVCVAAANALPVDETLAALADRFLLRAFVHPVADGMLETLLEGGETLATRVAAGVRAARVARYRLNDGARTARFYRRVLALSPTHPEALAFLSEHYAEMIARFKEAFARALPHLPRRELSWRLHFIMGALSYTLAGTDALKLIHEIAPGDGAINDELLLRRLAPFLLAGLTSPLADADGPGASLEGAIGHPPVAPR